MPLIARVNSSRDLDNIIIIGIHELVELLALGASSKAAKALPPNTVWPTTHQNSDADSFSHLIASRTVESHFRR
jgi:hypothetical protein